MKKNIVRRSRLFVLMLGVLLMAGLTVGAGLSNRASALGELSHRELSLEADVVPGSAPYDGTPTHTVKHAFTFQLQTGTGTNLGSIDFKYCLSPDPAIACTVPAGLHTTSAALFGQSGANTGFTLTNVSNGEYYLTRTAANGDNSTTSTYTISGVTNPDNTNCFSGTAPQSNNCTFYVRITTYTAAALGGSAVDQGSVAASTATPIVLTGYMPESLVFCTGGTVSTTGGVPDCSTATSGSIAFNQDFSPTATAIATSQMAASTNAGSGYTITVNGSTLQSGGNSINAMGATAGNSVQGKVGGQFGMNLVLNDGSPVIPYSNAPVIAASANVAPAANGTNLRGQAFTNYNSDDEFAYNSTDTVANSGSGGLGGTDAQIYTVSYIVNVSGSQPAGTYTTTLTYICTPTF